MPSLCESWRKAMKDKIREAVLKWAPTDADLDAMDILDRVEMSADLENQFDVDIFDDDMRRWTRVGHVVETVAAVVVKQRGQQR